jgi:hypothetical protein
MRLVQLLVLAGVLLGSVSCKKEDGPITTESRTELLVATNWRLDRITDVNGTTIATNRLGTSALVMNFIDIQFTSNNIARALDRSTKQIINGGTWYLVEDNQSLDVKVTGFTGIFPIQSLTRTRFSIRQTTKVDGVDTAVNLEFGPAV